LKTITIIDTFAFFFRAYYALPPLKNRDGFPTGLLTGFINFIHQLQREHSTDYILFALDSEGDTFRKEIYPEYKANRPKPPEDLIKQLPIAIKWIEMMGFANLTKERFEADDIIASIVKCSKEKGVISKIVSSDKDLYQLLDDNRVYIYDWVKQKSIDENGCLEKFGVAPKYFIDFQALIGDSSDNIPGVPGIGPKTASKLINEFYTLEGIYENIERVSSKRVKNLLLKYREEAFLSRELVKLVDNLFPNCSLEEFKFEDRNYLEPLIDEFKKYQMNKALKWAMGDKEEIGDKSEPKERSRGFEAILIDNREYLDEVLSKIKESDIVAFDTETNSLNVKEAKLVGFSFSFEDDKAYYVPIAHNYLGVGAQIELDIAKEAIKRLLKYNLIGQNLKFDLALLYNLFGFERVIPYGDTMILAWLFNPASRVGLDTLAKRYLNYQMKSYKETVKKNQDFSSVTIEEATFYASEDAWATRAIYFKLLELFKSNSLEHLLNEAKEVEFPFINVLIDMERVGIKVDTLHLESLRVELKRELEELTSEIYALAGSEFNIKSTQQLGYILFEKLGLKGDKKTKTGQFKTDEKVLNSLVDKHPIIEKILAYRERQKILSTYIEPLLKLAKRDRDSRIYTSFIQTGTTTGRLSSKEPNLQNIPIKSELGKRVRRAFIAKEDSLLVSIDYSQIELRLLAHFSQDEALKEAFLSGKDIHLATAIKLFGEKEAKSKRNFAKSINFGLLYGMGSRKLANELNISVKEAKEIIEAYFRAFPTVKSYLELIQERAKELGYVETLLKRRRVFDYEGASSMQKAKILREAVNTLFQGSAADLIKLSMLKIDKIIKDELLEANMLLQIHDELIFEIKKESANSLALRFKNIMEQIYPLNIPLKCSVSINRSWDKLK